MPLKKPMTNHVFKLLKLDACGGLRPKDSRSPATDAPLRGNRQEGSKQFAVETWK
ncbi:hypothetical protein SAMN04488498_114121 [Mesorhizobium albiziae]|uniref:Uncharacterized protein n=1 Tax=Neomesorhizobium albiziae TaxID=335020 RepID=A0A1I4CU77_9HYPH|nr:hypothetical protein GCM10007937_27530 [Mesorhizobium albiziae]SFK84874.1 hypothetical protein SAMN04488498_114121 [Mesorhizobium albiziae]